MRFKKGWMAILAVLVLLLVMALPAVALAQTEGEVLDLVATDNVVALVGSALFVVAVVNGLKKLYNLSGQKLVIVAMLLGVALQLAVYFLGEYDVFNRVMLGLLYGGGASGLWVLRRSSPEA